MGMTDRAVFALAREGDWDAAINHAIKKIKASHTAIEIASWLIEAGLSNRPIHTEADRVGQCLNPDKRQFFKLQEWWVIQARSGIKDLFQLECMFYGVSIPPELQAEERDRMLQAQETELENMLMRVKAVRQSLHVRDGRAVFGLPNFRSSVVRGPQPAVGNNWPSN